MSVGSQTVVFPGFDGGAEWGGSAFDPDTGLLYVNANEMAWTGSLAPNDSSDVGGRQVPVGLRVTSKAFGTGRRFPIAQKYTE